MKAYISNNLLCGKCGNTMVCFIERDEHGMLLSIKLYCGVDYCDESKKRYECATVELKEISEG